MAIELRLIPAKELKAGMFIQTSEGWYRAKFVEHKHIRESLSLTGRDEHFVYVRWDGAHGKSGRGYFPEEAHVLVGIEGPARQIPADEDLSSMVGPNNPVYVGYLHDDPKADPNCPVGQEVGNHDWDEPGCTCGKSDVEPQGV